MAFNTNTGVKFDLEFLQEDNVYNDGDCVEIFVEHTHGDEFSDENEEIIKNDITTLLYYIGCKTGYISHQQRGFILNKLSTTTKDLSRNIPKNIEDIKDIELKILMECLQENGMTLYGEDKVLDTGYLLDELTDTIIVAGDECYDYWHYAELSSYFFLYYGTSPSTRKPVYKIYDIEFDVTEALMFLYNKTEKDNSFDEWLEIKKKYWKSIR